MITNRTHFINSKNNFWYIIDAKDQTLGRLSTKIVSILNEKYNILYSPQQQKNSIIIVINANYIKISGNKYSNKIYKKHSGRPGGLRQTYFKELKNKIPQEIILKSVIGMLPKNKNGKLLCKNIKVYPDTNHPYLSLKPTLINL